MKKVESNLHNRAILVYWCEPDASSDSDKMIQCADRESRDEIMKRLRGRLGPDWQRDVIEHSRLRASPEPLMIIGIFGFATCASTWRAHPEDDKSGGGTRWVARLHQRHFRLGVQLAGAGRSRRSGECLRRPWYRLAGASLLKPPIMLTFIPVPERPRRSRREE